jgi:hypothetical protein
MKQIIARSILAVAGLCGLVGLALTAWKEPVLVGVFAAVLALVWAVANA